MDTRTTLAKLSAPRLGEIYRCERLHAALDRARERPIVWIAGAPGAGKTTLVAGWLKTRKQRALWYQLDASDSDAATFFHYLSIAAGNLSARKCAALPRLTPEHLPSLGAFARRYFETLGTLVRQQTALVLDNYHDVAPDSPLHGLLAQALPQLPPQVIVVVISRTEPPAAFARLHVNRHIALIGADELKLSADEAVGLARCLGHTQSQEFVVDLHKKTAGWAAGLVLLLECARNARDTTSPSDAGDRMAGMQTLFDYFAGEILSHSAPNVREVLLTTALLSRVSVTAARSLTGVAQTQDILEDLARRNYFTVRHPGSTEDSYEYHPLFRVFLLNQARAWYSSEEFDASRRAAALLLEAQGDVEIAGHLYLDLRDWEKSVELIATQAPQLLEQGRHSTLREWIAALPAERIDADPRIKLLLAAATQPADLVAARNYYTDAFEAFKKRDDASGAYSAWGGAVETFIYRWSDFTPLSRWIEELYVLRARHPLYPSATIEARVVGGMVNALMWRDPRHTSMQPWVERAEELLLDSAIPLTHRLAIANNLIFYRVWWLGDLAAAVHILATIKPLLRVVSAEPLPMLLWHVMESTYLAGVNAHDECLRTVADGLRLADASGIHVLDAVLNGKGVYASLFAGDLAGAADYLQRTQGGLAADAYLDIAHHHHQATWIALCCGDFEAAREQLSVCARFAEKSGTPVAAVWVNHTLPHVLLESGAYAEALAALDAVLRSVDEIQANAVKFHGLLSRAYVLLRSRDGARAVAALRQALALGKEHGYVAPPWIGWRRDVMAELCALALTHDIETEYVKSIIRALRLTPPAGLDSADGWPFPVRVYTLGRFAVTVNNAPVETTGTAARKPLALLKALIALGGRDVNQQKLVQALWPDADGDAGQKSFEVALHRLRKLFGAAAPLVLKNGELSLDARRCWVDGWALERVLTRLDQATHADDIDALFRQTLSLYQGSFLGRDEDLACTLPLRERLRSRLLRAALRAAERCERDARLDQAERIYMHLLEVEPATEEGYRRLVRLYQRQGRHTDALSCYRRCERVLHRVLGVAPSFTLDTSGDAPPPTSPPSSHTHRSRRTS